MPDVLLPLLQSQHIQAMSYYFAQFTCRSAQASMDSPLALVAALLVERKSQGDICLALDDIADQYHFEQEQADYYLNPKNQLKKQLLSYHCVAQAPAKQIILLDADYLYIGKLWHYEDYLAAQIKLRLQQPPVIETQQTTSHLNTLFGKKPDFDGQKLSAAICALNRFSVISGGPGTGKTTTLIKVIAILLQQQPNLTIELCAPTGKAAIRMLAAINQRKTSLGLSAEISQLIPDSAKTIHRLLSYFQGSFRYHQHNKIDTDLIIIDEASMIDLELMVALFKALPAHCQIILLGDKDQLSSVEAGHVFNDLCGRGAALYYDEDYVRTLTQLCDLDVQELQQHRGVNPENLKKNTIDVTSTTLIQHAIALLTQSYRFDQDSGIGQLAHLINQGFGQQALACFEHYSSELTWHKPQLEVQIDNAVIELIVQHASRLVSASDVEQALRYQTEFQVLCASHSGLLGVASINQLVVERLMLRNLIPQTQLFNGQTIIITQNDYDNELYNGDVGLVWQQDQRFYAYFAYSDTVKRVPITHLKHYELAWAITVHKSQGSEYNAVLLLLPNDMHAGLIKRELIYTAVTRAKQSFTLYAEADTFRMACQTKTQRQSQLSKKLGW